MPKTISFHNGSAWSRGHNIRDERYTDKQEHIDKALTENNVTVRDVPVRQAYDEIFGKAVEEYNDKQKRSDRKIDCYYDKIKKDKRKHPVYECIVQIGDKDDTGNSAELEKQALIQFAKEWDKRNPNLRLIGAYVHCDEPNGTVHMHVDYIPVAECTRGMKLQNSYDKALQQQGFISENIHKTAQIAWQDSEREALCAICRQLGIDAQYDQGISGDRTYLSSREYARQKDKAQAQIEEELKPLREEFDEYKALSISEQKFVVQKKKIPFNKKEVIVPIEDLEKIEKQAKAYRVNKPKIESIQTRQIEQDSREQALNEKEQDLIKQQSDFDSDKEIVEHEKKQVQIMYDEQKNLNQLYQKSKYDIDLLTNKVKSLETENIRLKDDNKSKDEQIKANQDSQRSAYEVVTNVVKAVSMLKWDKDDGYRADLTEEQGRLIDAIANYGAGWARQVGYPDLASQMDNKIGISNGIQSCIDEITPHKRSRGYER